MASTKSINKIIPINLFQGYCETRTPIEAIAIYKSFGPSNGFELRSPSFFGGEIPCTFRGDAEAQSISSHLSFGNAHAGGYPHRSAQPNPYGYLDADHHPLRVHPTFTNGLPLHHHPRRLLHQLKRRRLRLCRQRLRPPRTRTHQPPQQGHKTPISSFVGIYSGHSRQSSF